MATATNQEQLFLELINRARLDPVAEAARQGIDLNQVFRRAPSPSRKNNL
jgi:hypothetical protein